MLKLFNRIFQSLQMTMMTIGQIERHHVSVDRYSIFIEVELRFAVIFDVAEKKQLSLIISLFAFFAFE